MRTVIMKMTVLMIRRGVGDEVMKMATMTMMMMTVIIIFTTITTTTTTTSTITTTTTTTTTTPPLPSPLPPPPPPPPPPRKVTRPSIIIDIIIVILFIIIIIITMITVQLLMVIDTGTKLKSVIEYGHPPSKQTHSSHQSLLVDLKKEFQTSSQMVKCHPAPCCNVPLCMSCEQYKCTHEPVCKRKTRLEKQHRVSDWSASKSGTVTNASLITTRPKSVSKTIVCYNLYMAFRNQKMNRILFRTCVHSMSKVNKH